MNQPRRLPAYFLTFVSLGAAAVALGPALPSLALNTRSSLAQISYLFLARAVGDMAGAYLAGRLYDRLSSRALMVGALAGIGLTLAALPFIASLPLLLAVAVVLGMAGALLNVGGNTMTVWLYGRNAGPPLNGLHFAFALGAFAAPIIFAQSILRSDGIMWGFGILAALTLPSLLWLARLPAVPIPAPAAPSGPPPDNRLFTALACLFLFLTIGSEIAFGGWLYTYALAVGAANEASAAYLTSAFYGAIMAGRLAAVPLAARLRPRTILLTDLALALGGAGLMAARPWDSAALWIGVVGLGLGMASILTTLLSLAERRIRVTGQFTSWLFMSAGLGATFFPWLMGQLFTPLGPYVVPVTLLISMVAALFVALLLLRPSTAVIAPAPLEG
jgi:MFS transporter, FHS family, Na+ dependent glucose transporter 1